MSNATSPGAAESHDDSKPRRNWKNGAPSCRECVRLKLKCSRSWPCTSCVRRGCASICPKGTLPGRPQKNAAAMAALEKENTDLKAVISRLQSQNPSPQSSENGVAAMQVDPPRSTATTATTVDNYTPFVAVSPEPAQTSQKDSLSRDDGMLDIASGPPTGVMEWGKDGAKYLGRGAGSLFVLDDEDTTSTSLVFPFMASDRSILSTLHELFPPADEAYHLLQVYDEQVEWMYRPSDRTAIGEALRSIYDGGDIGERIHHVPPHRLATVLMVFAVGLTFAGHPMSRSALFFNAASALLCVPERHFMIRHSLASVEALHMMVSYLLTLGHSDTVKAAWPLLGLTTRIAAAIGLHRDPSAWRLTPEQQASRIRLWYECSTYDLFISLNFGRPYSMPTQLVDCPMPGYPADGGVTPSPSVFHAFKYSLAQVFFRISDFLANPELPDYSVVLGLDQELRRVEANAPAWLKWSDFYDPSTSKLPLMYATQQHSATCFYHKGLLVLHRPFFFKALEAGTEPLLGPYAASFTTCVTSARKQTRLIASLLRVNPTTAYNWWYFVFHAFTASVVQYSTIRKVPNSMMADEVRGDFEASYEIIKQMSEHSAVARRSLPVLDKLRERIQKTSPGAANTPATSEGDNSLFEMLLGSVQMPTGSNDSNISNSPAMANSNGNSISWAGAYDPTMPAMDGAMMLGFEQPVVPQDQVSLTDPLIQTLLYWNAVNPGLAETAIASPGFGFPTQVSSDQRPQ